MTNQLVNRFEDIRHNLKLLQDKLDVLELEMEKYSEQYIPTRSHLVDYLFKRSSLLEKIAYLKGNEDILNELQEKIRTNLEILK